MCSKLLMKMCLSKNTSILLRNTSNASSISQALGKKVLKALLSTSKVLAPSLVCVYVCVCMCVCVCRVLSTWGGVGVGERLLPQTQYLPSPKHNYKLIIIHVFVSF